MRTNDMHPLTITFARRIDGQGVGTTPSAAESIAFGDLRPSRTLVVRGCMRVSAFAESYGDQDWIELDGAGAGDGGYSH